LFVTAAVVAISTWVSFLSSIQNMPELSVLKVQLVIGAISPVETQTEEHPAGITVFT
jgi:hypothetical protein